MNDEELQRSQDELRRRAEETVSRMTGRMPGNPDALSPEYARQMLHELQVHQIELEMQNEELRRTQAALEASRAQYFDLFDLAPVGYIRLSGQGLILEANLAAAALLGVTRSTLVNQPLSRFVAREDQDAYYLHRKLVLEARTPQVCELRLTRSSGAQFWTRIEASAVRDAEGSDALSRWAISDITELKLAEEGILNLNAELEKRVQTRTAELAHTNRELNSFSYSVAHDLRAPLRAIDGFSASLLEDCGPQLDGVARAHLARIQEAAQRMGCLVDDLLRLSRVGRAMLIRERVSLSTFAAEIGAELRETAPGRDVIFVVHDGLEANADPHLVRILLRNLLHNAWKFTAGRPSARIVVQAETEGPTTVFLVRDNGVGFEMANAVQMFQPFQRLHSDEEYEGTGIGLAIAARIVQRHGGRIWAEGSLERGATIRFTLAPASSA